MRDSIVFRTQNGPYAPSEGMLMKQIVTLAIEALRPGHFVIGLDRSWLDTPFLSHRFLVKDQAEIEQLRASGIRNVIVDLSRSILSEQAAFGTDPDPDVARGSGDRDISAGDKTRTPGDSILEENLSRIELPEHDVAVQLTELHAYLVTHYQKLFDSIRKSPGGNPIETGPLRNAVEEIERLGRTYPDAFLFLAHLQSNDDETYIHSVNTMFLALYLAHSSNIPKDEAILWGLAGLFHDMGKVRIPIHILHKKEPLTADEWAIIREHPSIGETILKSRTRLPAIVSRVAGEHHVRKDGTGYPDTRLFNATESLTRAIMILDTFDAMTADRCYRPGISPAKALKRIAQIAPDSLDTRWTTNLLQSMGIYPVGSVLELSDGDVGVVTRYHKPADGEKAEIPGEFHHSFSVLVLRDRDGRHLHRPAMRRVTWSPSSPPPVSKTHNHSDWGIDWDYLKRHISLWTHSSTH